MFNRIWQISRNIRQKGKGVVLSYGWGNCLKKKNSSHAEKYTDISQSQSAAENPAIWEYVVGTINSLMTILFIFIIYLFASPSHLLFWLTGFWLTLQFVILLRFFVLPIYSARNNISYQSGYPDNRNKDYKKPNCLKWVAKIGCRKHHPFVLNGVGNRERDNNANKKSHVNTDSEATESKSQYASYTGNHQK